MPKRKDPLIEALKDGRSYTWTVPDGGDLASMRGAIQHGQTLTISPIVNVGEVQVGDRVIVKWHDGYLFHLVGQIEDDRFLIVNSLGKTNGWVSGDALLGRVTEVIDAEVRPELSVMLEQLQVVFQEQIDREQPADGDAGRLLAVVEDLRWYADRIGADRWDELPRSNKWSLDQLVWHLTRQARDAASGSPQPVRRLIDQGKQCVGLAAEIMALLEPGEAD